jgi:hypothetical protein
MKTVNTVVDDIYELMTTKSADESVDVEAEIDKFGEAVKQLMRTEFMPDAPRDGRKLRLSNIGRDDRYLWHHYNDTSAGEEIQGHTYVKFMYGHLIEEMLLFLCRMSGHTITDEQKVCQVEGITGHMDCRIDGIVTDIKSASTYGFKKFKRGAIAYEDPFGYVDQLKAYAYSEGETKFGWLVMDKSNGHLTYLKYDLEDTEAPVYSTIKGDIAARIRHVKKLVEAEEIPPVCAEPLADGKSGNMRLPVNCSYCHFKHSCYPELRTFLYSGGPRFLTEVVHEPKVQEIT